MPDDRKKFPYLWERRTADGAEGGAYARLNADDTVTVLDGFPPVEKVIPGTGVKLTRACPRDGGVVH